MHRTLRRWGVLAGSASLGAILPALGSVGFASAGPSADAATSVAPFTVAGVTGGSDSFNPFVLNANSGINGQALYLIYEPLYEFSTQSGAADPWLATSYTWSDGGRQLTFQLRHGVKWSDGKPFTSADVAYTFNLIKKVPALNQGGIQLSGARADGPYAVTITFPSPQYINFYDIAQTLIVPEHIWQDVKDPAKYADADPVGTGPYQVKSYTVQTVTLTPRSGYWGTKPQVPEVEINAYSGNTSTEAALDAGEVGLTGVTILGVNKVYVSRDPKTNHAGEAEVGVISLEPNLTVYPLDLKDVREAISLAINRTVISDEGEDHASPPVENQAAVVLPADKQYEDPAYAKPFPFSVAKAKSLLEAAGLKMGSNGFFESSSGKPITLTIEDPSGYTDYVADAGIIAQELKQIGLNVSVNAVSLASWTSDRADGNFQLIVSYSETNTNVYDDYQGWLDDALTAPIGKSATNDWERYSNKQTQRLVDLASSSLPTSKVFKNAIEGLERVVATQLPVIPLVYNMWHGEYSTADYVGWPTTGNPYAAVTNNNPDFLLLVMHLRPKS